ncbi:MAG: efflux transporter outer membrane subunit, partial [Caulobacteraceae bacterium]|nr:efflux transporter outer membrane subunit [Caulobacteraceae bacterium]
MALTACTTVGPNFERPAPPASAGFAMAGDPRAAGVTPSPDARPAGPWWRALGSPALDAVMGEALSGNRTVAAADASLRQAQALERAERGDRKPKVDASAGAERERINTQVFGIPGFPSPTINLYSVGGTVSYDLDVFGGGLRRVETAGAMAEAEAQRAAAAYLTLTSDVALQAIRIAGLRAQIATLQAIAADDQANIDIVRRAEAAGGEAAAASTSGKAQLAEDQALLPPFGQQLSQARHALALLVGKPPSAWTAPDFDMEGFAPPAHIPVSLPSALVRARPDILAAEADFHADTARIGVATADLYPDIRLFAGITQSALTPGSLFSYSSSGWNFGGALAAPIFNGGALRARRRAAEAQARASLARYQETVLAAFTQVADVLTALAHDDDRLDADARAEA